MQNWTADLQTEPTSWTDITGTFRLPATPPVLVGPETVLEAAPELYPFGVLRKRGQGTGPQPAGPCAVPRVFVLRPRWGCEMPEVSPTILHTHNLEPPVTTSRVSCGRHIWVVGTGLETDTGPSRYHNPAGTIVNPVITYCSRSRLRELWSGQRVDYGPNKS